MQNQYLFASNPISVYICCCCCANNASICCCIISCCWICWLIADLHFLLIQVFLNSAVCFGLQFTFISSNYLTCLFEKYRKYQSFFKLASATGKIYIIFFYKKLQKQPVKPVVSSLYQPNIFSLEKLCEFEMFSQMINNVLAFLFHIHFNFQLVHVIATESFLTDMSKVLNLFLSSIGLQANLTASKNFLEKNFLFIYFSISQRFSRLNCFMISSKQPPR